MSDGTLLDLPSILTIAKGNESLLSRRSTSKFHRIRIELEIRKNLTSNAFMSRTKCRSAKLLFLVYMQLCALFQ